VKLISSIFISTTDKFLIHLHKLCDTFGFGIEFAPKTICAHNGFIVFLMCFAEFGRHSIELTNSFFTVNIINRTQIRIELINQRVKLQIRQSFLNLVCSVNSEGKRNALAII